MEKFDLLVIALSLPGIDFIAKKLRHKIPPLPKQGELSLKSVLGSVYFCS